MYKILGADNREYGPITAEQIRQWTQQGRVNANTLVQVAGASEWRRLSAIPELADTANLPPVIGMSSSDLEMREHASKKIAAGICAILIGSLGIHKFILGYTTAGAIMLLVTVLTCGIGGIAMWVIGLVEGIVYLCKSDREFIDTYIRHKREWF